MLHHGISSYTTTCAWIKVYSFTEFSDHLTNTQVIGIGNYTGFVFPRLNTPLTLSWLPVNLGYKERELLDHCKYNTTCKSYQAKTCSYMYGVIHIGHFRTWQERIPESLGASSSIRWFAVLYGCVTIGAGSLIVPPAWSASRCFPVQSARSPYADIIFQLLYWKSHGSSTCCG
jgi:hypothetical protein